MPVIYVRAYCPDCDNATEIAVQRDMEPNEAMVYMQNILDTMKWEQKFKPHDATVGMFEVDEVPPVKTSLADKIKQAVKKPAEKKSPEGL